jgi:2-methylisocitrate lyase-like PEP mutase family enzyme
MRAKVAAALDARRDDDTIIIARTDAIGVLGFDEAVRRAKMYRDTGADVVFVEAPINMAQLTTLPNLVPGLHVANVVEGGLTPELGLEELRACGFSIVLYANAALRSAIHAIEHTLRALKRDGTTAKVVQGIASWERRQDLVGKARLDAMADEFAQISRRSRTETTELGPGKADARPATLASEENI